MHLHYKGFVLGVGLSIFIAALLFVLSVASGRENFFLALNFNGGSVLDFFFKYFTHLGDGLIWIPVLLVVIFFLNRKEVLPLLIIAFLLSTIITQVLKRFVFPDELRPIKVITDADMMHTVKGVDVHSLHSLPSGHTATAFAVYLIFCLLINNRLWILAGFIFSCIVAYSRIYLAQHFPVDVASGILISIFSVWIAMLVQTLFWRKKSHPVNLI